MLNGETKASKRVLELQERLIAAGLLGGLVLFALAPWLRGKWQLLALVLIACSAALIESLAGDVLRRIEAHEANSRRLRLIFQGLLNTSFIVKMTLVGLVFACVFAAIFNL
jgi:hypothetical protein